MQDRPFVCNFNYHSKIFMRELDPYPLTEEIKTAALDVYKRIISLKRKGQRRKHLQFFCLYTAYNELQIPQDPNAIAKMLGLKSGDMTKSLAIFSEVQTGFRSAPPMVKTPLDILPAYARQLQLSDELYDDLMLFAASILEKEEDPGAEKPQKMAAAILLYYLSMNGYEPDKATYASLCGISEGTLQAACKVVARLHNEPGK